MDTYAIDMRAVGELQSLIYSSLKHGHFKYLVKTILCPETKSRNMH